MKMNNQVSALATYAGQLVLDTDEVPKWVMMDVDLGDQEKHLCIHCGYLLKQNTKCIINGTEIDLSFFDENIELANKKNDFWKLIKCYYTEEKIVDKIIETSIIPKTLTVKTVDDVIKQQEISKPHCPTCGSTNIQKILGTKRWFSTGLFGLASGDIGKSMVCKGIRNTIWAKTKYDN